MTAQTRDIDTLHLANIIILLQVKRSREQCTSVLCQDHALVSLIPHMYLDHGLLGAVVEHTKQPDDFAAVVWDRTQLYVQQGHATSHAAAQAGDALLLRVADMQRCEHARSAAACRQQIDMPADANKRLHIAPCKLALPHMQALDTMQSPQGYAAAPAYPYIDPPAAGGQSNHDASGYQTWMKDCVGMQDSMYDMNHQQWSLPAKRHKSSIPAQYDPFCA